MNNEQTNSIKIDISNAAAALGRLGGSSRSERKAEAARENGKKGGRPRKLYFTADCNGNVGCHDATLGQAKHNCEEMTKLFPDDEWEVMEQTSDED